MHILTIPYQKNSHPLFTSFAKQPYAIFLDSCGLDRFDIICANPSQIWIAQNNEVDIFETAKRTIQNKAYDLTSVPQDLPFTIGLMGYFSYDLGLSLLNIKPQNQQDINLPGAFLGFYEWSIVVDHLHKASYLISLLPSDHPDIEKIKQKIFTSQHQSESFRLLTNFTANMDQTQYSLAFNQIKRHIQEGDCYQINLAQRFTAYYQGSTWSAYQNLRKNIHVPMAAYLNLLNGTVLSFSPERFLKVTHNQVVTQPIKGTSPRFNNYVQDQLSKQKLLESEKDRAENIMIVDLLRNDLGKCCQPGSIKVENLCMIESFKNVHHLVSTISGILEKDQHPFDLLKSCFPGGSITGAPKKRAMEIINNLEPHHRSLYCGSIAYCDVRGYFDSNIMIRTLISHKDKIHCYGGGGLVYDSTVENEYQEINIKIRNLLLCLLGK